MASPLSNISIPGSEIVTDSASGREVFHVANPHALTQAAGYLKFIEGPARRGVFFRGQRKLYKTLSPTLFRDIATQEAQSRRIRALRQACASIARENIIFDQIPPEAHEPLLQHYGLNTSWLDLVDNIWIALWFACHRAMAVGPSGCFLHFERRDPADEQEAFAYILLVAADIVPSDPFVPGLWRGSNTELVDLRVSAPSIFLRPHAQHGVLFRMRGNAVRRPLDYAPQVVGTIRVDLRHALKWLGEAATLSTHALFPPPFYDKGYGFLLERPLPADRMVGGIQHIGS